MALTFPFHCSAENVAVFKFEKESASIQIAPVVHDIDICIKEKILSNKLVWKNLYLSCFLLFAFLFSFIDKGISSLFPPRE